MSAVEFVGWFMVMTNLVKVVLASCNKTCHQVAATVAEVLTRQLVRPSASMSNSLRG